MAFWLVYQGDSWARARAGNHLWAPKRNKLGRTNFYHENMTRVRPGELIFSGVDNAVRAVSQSIAPAYTATRPDPDRDGRWDEEGWRLDVVYTDLKPAVPYSEFVPLFPTSLQKKYGAFRSDGGPNQGYMFEIPLEVGQYLIEYLDAYEFDSVGKAAEAANAYASKPTERQILAKARVGQGQFRADVLEDFGGRCGVSGLAQKELLRASHIKPWAGCSDLERLDPFNGLLLSAAYDAAFDARLISFGEDGSLILAPDFDASDALKAGIDPKARLTLPDAKRQTYLAAHREMLGKPRVSLKQSGARTP